MRRKTSTTIESPIRLQEKHYQKQILDYALLRHWLVYHDFYALRNARGLPDNIFVREGVGGFGRLVIAEIKVVGGRLRPEQKQWITALKSVPGVETYVWWFPDDWDEAMRVLE